jgi:hypothetical protein
MHDHRLHRIASFGLLALVLLITGVVPLGAVTSCGGGCDAMECILGQPGSSCTCGKNDKSGGASVSTCEDVDMGAVCCVDSADGNNPLTCYCGDRCTGDPATGNFTIVPHCNAGMTTCDLRASLGSANATSGGSSGGGCWHPNWESDCPSTTCDPGLMCTAACASCSTRCHGIACSSDADCQTTYGSLTMGGSTYCASHCGSDGTCQF